MNAENGMRTSPNDGARESFEGWLRHAGEAKRLALISHISPDGDTLGAALALHLAFLSLGKQADVFCEDDVPDFLRFLPGSDAYKKPEQAEGRYDVALAVDSSDRTRLGSGVAIFDAADRRLVIDHHATNLAYGESNFIRRGESATCLLAYEAIRALGAAVTRDMATCLMVGMSTDTGHFQYPSTSAATLIAAGELLSKGVDLSLLTRRLYRTQPMCRVRLARVVYNKLRFVSGGRIGTVALTREDFAATGTTPDQADGLVNKALEVEGVRMAVLASQREDGVKMSLRAIEPDDVSGVAVAFGGGGHAQAAGCLIDAPLEEAVSRVLAEMERTLDARDARDAGDA